MIIGKIDALMSLVPGAEYVLQGDGTLIWMDESITQPTDSAIDAEVKRLQADYDNKEYQRKRKAEYPLVVEQLDLIYHSGIDAWKAKIKETKDKYPKP
tara:strand:+ start:1111 stop:1404 length:294 start_codon:yes stop_codon:yes gene_type:complete